MSTKWRSALAQAMIEDLRVAILPESSKEATAMFREMCDYVPPAAEARIIRTNGNQKIGFPTGGTVYFLGGNRGPRGLVLDKLYASLGGHGHLYEDLYPSVCTSRVGEVIYF